MTCKNSNTCLIDWLFCAGFSFLQNWLYTINYYFGHGWETVQTWCMIVLNMCRLPESSRIWRLLDTFERDLKDKAYQNDLKVEKLCGRTYSHIQKQTITLSMTTLFMHGRVLKLHLKLFKFCNTCMPITHDEWMGGEVIFHLTTLTSPLLIDCLHGDYPEIRLCSQGTWRRI